MNNKASLMPLLLSVMLAMMPMQMVLGEHVCRDDPTYRFDGGTYHDCDWVELYNRCNHKDSNNNKIGSTYCPVSCDKCPNSIYSSTVSTDETCYEHNKDEIVVTFQTRYPHDDDFIGIYKSSDVNVDDVTTNKEPIMWLWACNGDQENTFCKVSYGQVTFDSGYVDKYSSGSTWPLPTGSYRVVVGEENSNGAPYDLYSVSNIFEVDNLNHGCHNVGTQKTPSASPSPAPSESPTKHGKWCCSSSLLFP